MQFKAPYDGAARAISAGFFVIILMSTALNRNLIVGGVLALAFAAAYAWSPAGYEIDSGDVVIKRLIGNLRIPLSSIREVKIAARNDLSGSMRVFGSGGLFGYYGRFRNGFETSQWYVTDRNRAVILTTDSGTIIVSPDDVAGFTAALGNRVPNRGHDWSTVGQHSGGHGWITVAVVIAAAALAGVTFLYSPGPPNYTLTKTALEIHDRFYPVTLEANNVDVSNVRVIDFDKDTSWKPVLRVGGVGAPHYRAGWFRVASGQKVRMYRTDSKRVVLLPPKGDGAPVLLETKDPDKFVVELEREWG